MAKAPLPPALTDYADMRGGIVAVLQAARVAVARNVNTFMTASYREIGHRIVEAEQKVQRRAGYGEQLVERLAVDLTSQFGRGFSRQNLQQMRLFYLAWPILQTPSGELEAAPKPGLWPNSPTPSPSPGPPTSACCPSKASPPASFTRPKPCVAAGAYGKSLSPPPHDLLPRHP